VVTVNAHHRKLALPVLQTAVNANRLFAEMAFANHPRPVLLVRPIADLVNPMSAAMVNVRIPRIVPIVPKIAAPASL